MQHKLKLLAVLFTLAFQCYGSDHVIYERCPRGKYHKVDPSPQPDLVQCAHFRTKACCTNDSVASIENDIQPSYNFNFSHCGKPLSAECKNYFTQNNCFYECSPNAWPWITPVPGKTWRKERFYEVPLCQSNCDDWFNACKDDLTCAYTWNSGFVWQRKNNGRGGLTNVCKPGSECRTFRDTYKTPRDFCENVWGPKDYRVVTDDSPCVNFIEQELNTLPKINEKVANFYAKKKGLICDSEDLEEAVKKLGTEVTILTIFLVIIAVVITVACFAYFRCSVHPGNHHMAPSHLHIGNHGNHDHAYTAAHHQVVSFAEGGSDSTPSSHDSKVSFVDNYSDKKPLTHDA